MWKRQRHPDSHREGIAHRTQGQVRVPLGEMYPFDSLPAERGHYQLVRHLWLQPFEAFISNHMVKSPVNNRATGCLSAFIMRTASLILISKLSPLVKVTYCIPKDSSCAFILIPYST